MYRIALSLILVLFCIPIMFCQNTIFAKTSCEPLQFKFTPDGMSNGKIYYENNLDPVRTRMRWGGSAWFFQAKNDKTFIGFEFMSTVDVGIEPPCFEDGNWQLLSGDGICSTTALTAFYFDDGRCNPVPTLSQWV